MYKVETNFGTWDDILLQKREYNYGHTKGRVALQLFSKSEGPFATISVNLVDEDLTDSKCFFVDTNNCPWAEDFLTKNKIAEFTGNIGLSGFCTYPEYRLIKENL